MKDTMRIRIRTLTVLLLISILPAIKSDDADDLVVSFGIQNDGYLSEFSVVNHGRLIWDRVLLTLEDLSKDECIAECVDNIECIGVSYSATEGLCELNDIDFDRNEAVKEGGGWINYATPGIVDGAWTQWARVTGCSRTCGGGRTKYQRSCTNPIPRYGGAECPGRDVKYKRCNTRHCPVAGGWGNWTSEHSCSRSCGGGTIKYYRICNNPKPQYGGADCTGDYRKTEQCNTQQCGDKKIQKLNKTKQH